MMKVLRGVNSNWIRGQCPLGSLRTPSILGKVYIRLPVAILILILGFLLANGLNSPNVVLPIFTLFAFLWLMFTNLADSWPGLIIALMVIVAHIYVFVKGPLNEPNVVVIIGIGFLVFDLYAATTQYTNKKRMWKGVYCDYCGRLTTSGFCKCHTSRK